MVSQNTFIKPLSSVIRQDIGEPHFYYMTPVADIAKIAKKYGITPNGRGGGGNWSGHQAWEYPIYDFFTKTEIDRIPKHMRRGGEYGHDPIRISRNVTMSPLNKAYIRRYGLDIVRI